MSDELIELPEGWEWTIAIEACSKVIDCHNKTAPYTDSGIKLVRTSNIRNGKIDLKTTKFVDQPTYEFWSRRCFPEPGDLLFTREAPMAEVGMIPPEEKICMGQRMMLLRADNQNLLNSYLLYVLQAPFIKAYADRVSVGTGVKHLRVKDVESLPIPIPPIAEQNRIVAKIEELRSKTQKTREALEAIPEMCDRFRQSVLAAAFRGDLTADWREENTNIQSAEVLLGKIQAERANKKLLKPIEQTALPDLPDKWCWSSVEQIADVRTGATPLRSETKYYEGGNIPWITSGALNDLFITEAEEHITASAIQETNAKIFPKHTLLIAMYGEGKTRGKVSELLIEAATNQACAALILEGTSSKIQPIVKLFFQKNYSDIRKLASGGVQPNLNLSMIKTALVPIPPLEEQLAILQIVSSCTSFIDRIQQQYEDAKARLEKLDRAILAKAFRGELVPQDPNDEPASVLLEQIREERSKVSDRKSTKRKK